MATAITVVCLLLLPTVAFAGEPTFTFTGRGWGHGIGLSQYGSKGYAEKGWKYDAILKHYYQGATLGSLASEPTVRVAIDKDAAARASWTLRTNQRNGYVEQPSGTVEFVMLKGKAYRFAASGSNVTIVDVATGSLVKTLPSPVRVYEYDGGFVEVVDASGPLGWTNLAYRGVIRLKPSGSSIAAYSDVGMEDYVRCVAPRETPASWHTEALKAQTVAARSYAYVSIRSTGDFDVFCTARSQVYNAYGKVTGGVVVRHGSDHLYDAPLAATRNQVMKSGSTVIQTFFFSTSGGHTENIENVWFSATPRSYYRGVVDSYEYAAGSPYHVWPEKTTAYTATKLRSELLEQNTNGSYKYFAPSEVPASIVDVVMTKRGVSGRVTELLLRGASGDHRYIRGSKVASFRSALGLRETWMYATGFRWDSAGIYLEPGGSTEAWFTVTPAISGSLGGFVLRRADGTTVNTGATVSGGVGRVKVPAGYVGVRYDSGSLLPAVDMRGKQGYFYGPELGVTSFSKTERIAGEDRYATAAAASQKSFTATAAAVVLASGASPADALAGAPLAGSVAGGAPVLLVKRDLLPSATLAEITRLKPKKVYILGGKGAVSEAVEAQVRAAMPPAPDAVERIGGVSRYDTARLIALKVKEMNGGADVGRVFAVSGRVFADAVAAAPLAYRLRAPVLLVDPRGITTSTIEAAASLGVTGTLVVGGTGAVSDEAASQLPGAVRIAAGANRYDTAALLADWAVANAGFAWTAGYVCSGHAYSDALAAGPLAGRAGVPLLFVAQDRVPAETRDVLSANKVTIARCYVIGGSLVVTNGCRGQLEDAIR